MEVKVKVPTLARAHGQEASGAALPRSPEMPAGQQPGPGPLLVRLS